MPDLENCGTLVDDLTSFGVSSESTRYGHQRSGKKYPLHDAQTYLYPIQLNSATNAVCRRLLRCAESDDLHLCSTGDYKRPRLQELEEAAAALDKNWDMLALEGDSMAESTQRAVMLGLDSMDHRSLALIVMSLYFSGPPITVENLQYFEGLPPERLLEKILERAHLREEARQGLESHIKEVMSRLAERRGT